MTNRKNKKLRGSVMARGDGWLVRVYDSLSGKQKTWRLSGDYTERKAQEFADAEYDKVKAQVRRMKDTKATGVTKMTFSELLQRYIDEWVKPTFSPGAQRCYEQSFVRFRSYFIDERDNPLIASIKSPDVMKFLSWRRAHPIRGTTLSEATIRRDRSCLHGLFQFAVRLGLLDKDGEGTGVNPVARVPNPKPEERDPVILSDAEYELLLNECASDSMLSMFVLTMGETGARSESEVLWLKWEHLDFENGFLTIKSDRKGHRTKTAKSRRIPMSSRLKKALEAHVAKYEHTTYDGVRSPWVFHYTETRGKQQAGGRIVRLYQPFKRAAKRAGVAAVTQHDLRHRTASIWAPKSITLAAAALGHSSTKMTERYVHLKPKALQALVE